MIKNLFYFNLLLKVGLNLTDESRIGSFTCSNNLLLNRTCHLYQNQTKRFYEITWVKVLCSPGALKKIEGVKIIKIIIYKLNIIFYR